ncbi:hypothetical protein [Sandaracinus amylolyticus]|uniref:hypothetical protein n=1 Tax=Sandaracinus amylolyticus TaxID=927083 RepID=UPI001F471CE7|nr:hypothetical protein [Sandaracinus amylolyticus]UJR86254.1 Hypothetical protein I5071_83360 [Sandaracinus amylolyticus]
MRKAWTNAVVTGSLGVALCAGCGAETPPRPPAPIVSHGGERAEGTPPALIEIAESSLVDLPTAPGPSTAPTPSAVATPSTVVEGEPPAPVALECPSDVAGLEARAISTARGAALVLRTTETDQVDELRRRVRALASALDEERRESEAAPAMPRFAADGAMHQTREVRLQDVARGVRMELFPRDGEPAARRELRDELREDARVLAEGRCPLRFQST